jgi:hypothetical protein
MRPQQNASRHQKAHDNPVKPSRPQQPHHISVHPQTRIFNLLFLQARWLRYELYRGHSPPNRPCPIRYKSQRSDKRNRIRTDPGILTYRDCPSRKIFRNPNAPVIHVALPDERQRIEYHINPIVIVPKLIRAFVMRETAQDH